MSTLDLLAEPAPTKASTTPRWPPTLTGLTCEQFADLDDRYRHHELVHGVTMPMAGWDAVGVDREGYIMPGPQNIHDALVRWLGAVLLFYTQEYTLGEVRGEPFEVHLDETLTRRPDLFFIAAANLHRLRERALEGPPDLAIEIISPGSERTDRGDKFDDYERAGVLEYWILDPHRRRAEFYQLDDEGVFRPFVPNELGIYPSRVLPDFRLNVAWLWQEPLPKVMNILPDLTAPSAA